MIINSFSEFKGDNGAKSASGNCNRQQEQRAASLQEEWKIHKEEKHE
jgi:hypothetical protein